MTCPDYYWLASNREFIDFANNELSAWLMPRVSYQTYHCIISAMEHRFRCGNKEGEAESDEAAERFWLCQAFGTHLKDTETCYLMGDIMPAVLAMVDSERRRKDLKRVQS